MSFQALSSSLVLLIAEEPESIASLLWEGRRAIFDGRSFSAFRFEEEWQGLFFLPEKSLFHITHVDSLKEKDIAFLASFFSSIPPSLTLLLSAESFTLPLKLRKEVEKYGQIMDCLSEKLMIPLLLELARRESVDLPVSIAKELITHFGKERTLLLSEIKKLFLFVGEKRSISIDDLSSLLPKSEEKNLWLLGEAIFSCDFKKAHEIATFLINEGSSLIALLAQLRGQIRSALLQLSLFEKEGKEGLFARYPNIPPRLFEKKLALFMRYGKSHFLSALLALAEIELKAKNSEGDETLLLEILLTRIIHDPLSSPQFARTRS